jgi:hypothetical protein
LSAKIIVVGAENAHTEGKNCSKNFLPFQFKITIAKESTNAY